MTIRGLGDVNVETTINASGSVSASDAFTQTTNETYDVNISTSPSTINIDVNTGDMSNMPTGTNETATVYSLNIDTSFDVSGSVTIDAGVGSTSVETNKLDAFGTRYDLPDSGSSYPVTRDVSTTNTSNGSIDLVAGAQPGELEITSANITLTITINTQVDSITQQ